jgi:hypothetical protein
MVTLIAAISAVVTSMIKITILVMLASTPLAFMLYVHYAVKVMCKMRVGYMAGGTGSWEEMWQIFPNLSSVHGCMWVCIWPITVYLLRTYIPLLAPTNMAHLQVTYSV